MDDRAEALRQIGALARRYGLTPEEVAAAVGAPPSVSVRSGRATLVRVLGFLGGTFVFAGIGIFVALQWDALNSVARVIVTLGSGVAALVLALVGVRDRRFEQAVTPLLLVAAALEPSGMLVAFEEFGAGGDWRLAALITCGTMALQFAGLFVALWRSTLLFLVFLFATFFWGTALDLAGADETVIALVLGSAQLAAAVGADRRGRRDITPFWYFVGAVLCLYGLFDAVKRSPFELVFILAAAGFVYASVVLHSRALLTVATLAILAYTGWFTNERFVDSVGWPLALVAFGLVLIALSALAFRIDREYLQRRGPAGG